METEKRLFLEDILVRTEALMEQCAEIRRLVSDYLKTDVIEDIPEPESVDQAPETENITETVLSPDEDLPESDKDLPESDLPLLMPESVEQLPPAILEEPVFAEPAIEIEESVIPIFEKARQTKVSAMVDKLADRQAWRTDLPGAKVSDIRSAISLNDRILFINTLFGEDPSEFKNALSALNAMTSFEDAEKYIISNYPDWDLESETVYRFMMAVRRRLQ